MDLAADLTTVVRADVNADVTAFKEAFMGITAW
jgi:hypothetical protein